MAAIEVFNRYEKKFIIRADVCNELQQELRQYMVSDEYNKDFKPYSICNIYYDTVDNNLIRTSLLKPAYKEKLRLRAYGVPTADDIVFLEIKKKFCGLTNKRRIRIGLMDAYDFLEKKRVPKADYINQQILSELNYFVHFYNPEPKLYLAYDRYAYFSKENRHLRVSIDLNIRARRTDLRLECGDFGERIVPEHMRIMEIKAEHSIPVWLAALLSKYHVYSTGFSKYGTEYQNYLWSRLEKGENACSNHYFPQPILHRQALHSSQQQ